MVDEPKTGLELLHKLYAHRIDGLDEGQAPTAEQLLKAAIDQPLSLDDLEEIFEFIEDQEQHGVEGVMVFDSGVPGPTLGVTAVTHGNEPAGLASLPLLIALQENNLMQNGRVIFTANNLEAAEAFFEAETAEGRAKTRKLEGDINMNRLDDRVMESGYKTNGSYAADRARALKRFWHQFDVGVDLHSTSTAAPPMAIAHRLPDERRKHLFSNLPAEDLITGIYGYLSGNSVTEFFGGRGKPAVTLTMECGQHEDEKSFDVAQNTVVTLLENMQMMPIISRNFAHDLNALSDVTEFAHFDFPDWDKGAYKPADGAIFHPAHDIDLKINGLSPEQVRAIKADTYMLVNERPKRDHSFGEPIEADNNAVWRNFERVSQGDVIMRGVNTGYEVRAKKDGQMLMAPSNPEIGPDYSEAVAFVSAPVRKTSLQASPTYRPETWLVEHPAIDKELQERILSGELPTSQVATPVDTIQQPVEEQTPPHGFFGNLKYSLEQARDATWRVVSSPLRAAGILPKWDYRFASEATLSEDARTPITGARKKAPIAEEKLPSQSASIDNNVANISAQTTGQPPSPQDLLVVSGTNSKDLAQQATLPRS